MQSNEQITKHDDLVKLGMLLLDSNIENDAWNQRLPEYVQDYSKLETKAQLIEGSLKDKRQRAAQLQPEIEKAATELAKVREQLHSMDSENSIMATRGRSQSKHCVLSAKPTNPDSH
jgi:chromosome segregation ATPase